MQEAEMVGSLAEKCLDSLCIGPTVSPQKLLRSIPVMLTDKLIDGKTKRELLRIRNILFMKSVNHYPTTVRMIVFCLN